MLEFIKIVNWIGLVITVILGIIIPIDGIAAGSFVSICTGLLIIMFGFDDFIDIKKRIKKEEQKDKKSYK